MPHSKVFQITPARTNKLGDVFAEMQTLIIEICIFMISAHGDDKLRPKTHRPDRARVKLDA